MAQDQRFRLEGIDNVLRNLNKEVSKIKGRSMKGLINAAIFIRRETENTPPRVPVGRTGNLHNSWFTVTAKSKQGGGEFGIPSEAVSLASETLTGPVVVIGFSANYAAAVHEMVQSKKGKKINWNRPGSGAKYLETHLNNNQQQILNEISKPMEL